ncbi:MAG: excinuclease ABC subunit UvrA [Planctomycetota bacterium]
MAQRDVVVRGARTHNLKNVDVRIPRGSLTTITGVSGSGKSSLAFDTIHNEGQRRFLESLSSYARQFLGQIEKPDVDQVEGLSPTVSIDQKTVNRNPRSTVGTVTEVYDFLRLLFARVGVLHCPDCGEPIRPQTVDEVHDTLMRDRAGRSVVVLAPIVKDRKGEYRKELEDLRLKGYVRARIDGEIRRLDEEIKLARYVRHTIEVVLDRVTLEPEKSGRLVEALEQAIALGDGVVAILDGEDHRQFSTRYGCKSCGKSFPEVEPRSFSFNSPHGACARCDGLGRIHDVDPDLIVPDASKTIEEGALAVLGNSTLTNYGGVSRLAIPSIAKHFGVDLSRPWAELDEAFRDCLIHGSAGEEIEIATSYQGKSWQVKSRKTTTVAGLLAGIRQVWADRAPRHLERYLADSECSACGGRRLGEIGRAVRFRDEGIADLARRSIEDLAAHFRGLEFAPREAPVGEPIRKEIGDRLAFLEAVGLGYLSLDRSAATLSGGESQRIRLATQVGSKLKGILYVLDEPSIGLHHRDNRRLIETLEGLRDLGNTVCVVEHDQEMMERSDHVIDLGPGAGVHGGEVVGEGTLTEVLKSERSKTADFLSGRRRIAEPESRRLPDDRFLSVLGARENNLRDVDAHFPVGLFTVVTGVSGSGKSTLVDTILKRKLSAHFFGAKDRPGRHRAVEGLEHFDKVIEIDQSPIGRTPRSNPATYTKVFDLIRDLFAATPEAKARAYAKGRFSFNVAGGRCEACQGAGVKVVSMQFLPDVEVECEDCGGRRFNPETLEILYRGVNISQVLDMTFEDAAEFFAKHPKIARTLDTLNAVGLGYVRLGQPATTLSGGEAQRVKLASELRRPATGRTLYLLDEPTTGLHFEDIDRLIGAMQGLVEAGNTVIVIEHNLDVVKVADWIVDLGPEGGSGGGEIVAQGPDADVLRNRRSHTAAALRELAKPRKIARRRRRRIEDRSAEGEITVVGARTHNLRAVDARIPSGKFTVVTGPSGSGKTSLAFDTLFAEGQRRFVESLSSYARQFLGRLDKAPVDRIDGLGPAIAIDQKAGSRNPRSTVATTTEIYDYMRLLWARVGVPHCPRCDRELAARQPAEVWRELKDRKDEKGRLCAPLFSATLGAGLALERPGQLRAAVAGLRERGYLRLLVDGEEVRLDAPKLPAMAKAREIWLVVDRLAISPRVRGRALEAVEQAYAEGNGLAGWVPVTGEPTWFTRERVCPVHGVSVERDLPPRLFSFNSLVGSCPTCIGVGRVQRCDADLLVNAPEKPVLTGGMRNKVGRFFTRKSYFRKAIKGLAKENGFDVDRPWKDLSEEARRLILDGSDEKVAVSMRRTRKGESSSFSMDVRWPGLRSYVERWFHESDSDGWRQTVSEVMRTDDCPDCRGRRLRPTALAVRVDGRAIDEVGALRIGEARAFFEGLRLGKAEKRIAERLQKEIGDRLGFLERVGLDYLTLDRSAGTLSGGESQRIRLATQIGSRLSGVLYVLDEPSIGLHQRDVEKLLGTLGDLVSLGNTVVVVEHDEETMRAADWILDLGPGAGHLGGQIVYQGPRTGLEAADTLTGAYLSGRTRVARVTERRGAPEHELVLRGAATNNLRGLDVAFPLGRLVAVAGVSGSGKSSLVFGTLVPALERSLRRSKSEARPVYERLEGVRRVDDLVLIDQAPIGRSPKSNPATYTGVFDLIRAVFATSAGAKLRGFKPGRFSFNAPGGRCEACAGRGAVKIEMNFLADVWMTCDVCRGRRYNRETLAAEYRGKSIADVLDMEVEVALEFFANHRRIAEGLRTLVDVGLGYLKMGQASNTLSGGEAQRIKLARELAKKGGQSTLYVLDEPTTGLHFDDVKKLIEVLHRLVEAGHGVIVIEHNLDVIASADHVIELGPGGGDRGGSLVAAGTPEEIAARADSPTGRFLAPVLSGRGAKGGKKVARRKKKGASDGIPA